MLCIICKIRFENERYMFSNKDEAFNVMKKHGYTFYYEISGFYHEKLHGYCSKYYFYEKGLAHKMHCKLKDALEKAYGYMPEYNGMPYILVTEE